MKIVTTPMCREILDIVGITDYNLTKHTQKEKKSGGLEK